MNSKDNYKFQENNKVNIIGVFSAGFKLNHIVFGEGFYSSQITVERSSGEKDIIPLMISEYLVDITKNYSGMLVHITGQFRSFNNHNEGRNRLMLFVFAREVEFVWNGNPERANKIFLDGYICKNPVYRRTPLGREITDMLLAVNRPYGKSDYIPCICWGRNARFAAGFEVGGHVQICGRIQSRKYLKKLEDETMEERVAYEISTNKIWEVRNEND